MISKQFATLECFIIPSAIENASTPTVVMLHGYGANAHDLAPLAGILDPERNYRWVFPNAPLLLGANPYFESRAWFPIDMDRLQNALETGDSRYFSDSLPDDFQTARASVYDMLQAMNLDGPLVLGGFSQGSMIAADLTFSGELEVSKLILLSTTMVARPRWEEFLSKSTKSFRVFQSHGRIDPVLPYQAALEVKSILERNKVELSFIDFNDGHTIAPEALNLLSKFLAKN